MLRNKHSRSSLKVCNSLRMCNFSSSYYEFIMFLLLLLLEGSCCWSFAIALLLCVFLKNFIFCCFDRKLFSLSSSSWLERFFSVVVPLESDCWNYRWIDLLQLIIIFMYLGTFKLTRKCIWLPYTRLVCCYLASRFLCIRRLLFRATWDKLMAVKKGSETFFG